MRIKGYNAIEVVVALFIWSIFLSVFRSQLIRQYEKEMLYNQTLNHYHVIENIMYLDTLGVLYRTSYGFNEKGIIDINGNYQMVRIEGIVTIYYLEKEIYTYEST